MVFTKPHYTKPVRDQVNWILLVNQLTLYYLSILRQLRNQRPSSKKRRCRFKETKYYFLW